MATARAVVECEDDPGRLLAVDDAFAALTGLVRPVEGGQQVTLDAALGRVTAADIMTGIPLPPFDHAAVDGYGLAEADLDRSPPHRLRLAGRVAAGGAGSTEVTDGQAVRIYTGAAVPSGVVAVVPEERCRIDGNSVVLNVSVPAGANVRRRGEDVGEHAVIVDGGSLLDARHVAILASAGYARVRVRRRIRVAVISTGDELRPSGAPLDFGTIYDSNRPMLSALVARPWTELMMSEHVGDAPHALANALRSAVGERADLIVTSGGAAGSETDQTARAIVEAGGTALPLRVALRPGKPVVNGTLGEAPVLGLPGNPVAALVNFLLFGRAMLLARAGAPVRRPRGQPAVTATPLAHTPGRTEFAPARIVGVAADGRARVEKIGRGGSARLRPLVLADGLIEVAGDSADLPTGAAVSFHPFEAGFSL